MTKFWAVEQVSGPLAHQKVLWLQQGKISLPPSDRGIFIARFFRRVLTIT
jgi:hypothetical protein